MKWIKTREERSALAALRQWLVAYHADGDCQFQRTAADRLAAKAAPIFKHSTEPAWLWPACVGGPIVLLSIVFVVFA